MIIYKFVATDYRLMLTIISRIFSTVFNWRIPGRHKININLVIQFFLANSASCPLCPPPPPTALLEQENCTRICRGRFLSFSLFLCISPPPLSLSLSLSLLAILLLQLTPSKQNCCQCTHRQVFQHSIQVVKVQIFAQILGGK